jgi:hypothetical protein
MPNLRDRLRKIPTPLLFALVVAVGATVVMVLQINILPPPPAIVAPINTGPDVLTGGSQTVMVTINAYAGQTVVHANLAALGRVSLQVNTTGWHYQANDWIFTAMRRSTGNATFSLPTGVQVEVFQYNSTHALVVNRQRNTVLITKIVSVGGTGWYAYHPIDTVYDSATINGLVRFMSFRGLSQVNVFRPRADYVTFDPSSKVFRVYFDVVASSGQVTTKGTSLTNSSNFVVLPSGSAVVPTNYFIIDINNVVLPPVWVIHKSNPTSSIRSALTITPLTAP